jgi:hypothetical protein
MPKSTTFQKTTANSSQSTDATSITVNGTDLSSAISDLIDANELEDAILENCALVGSNNTFTGANTYNNPIQYASNVGPGSITNAKHLVTKEYCDASASNLLPTNNTWTGTNAFIAGSHQIGKNDGSTSVTEYGPFAVHGATTFDSVPATATDVTASITDDKQLANKKYVDNKVNSLLSSNNTFSGTEVFNGASTFNGGLTVANCFTASNGVFSLSEVPTLQGNYSQPSGNCLTTKAYGDSVVPYTPTTDTVLFGMTTTIRNNSGSYILEAPYLGTSTASNSAGTYFSFYINFPTTSNGPPSYGILQNNVTFDLNYWFYQNGVVTGSSSHSGSTATFSGLIGNGQLTNLVGIFGLTNIQATFHVAIRNSAVLVYGPYQSTKIWNNPTTTSGTQSAVQFTNSYNTSSILMKYYPIQFSYVNDQKIQVQIGFPNQENNPTKAYWISNCGFTVKLRSSMPCTANNFARGNVVTAPTSGVNTMSGGAWVSTS